MWKHNGEQDWDSDQLPEPRDFPFWRQKRNSYPVMLSELLSITQHQRQFRRRQFTRKNQMKSLELTFEAQSKIKLQIKYPIWQESSVVLLR